MNFLTLTKKIINKPSLILKVKDHNSLTILRKLIRKENNPKFNKIKNYNLNEIQSGKVAFNVDRCHKKNNIWNIYKNTYSHSINNELLIIPSGHYFLDLIVKGELESQGKSINFFPLWDFIDCNYSFEDLLYSIGKNYLQYNKLFLSIISYIKKNKSDVILINDKQNIHPDKNNIFEIIIKRFCETSEIKVHSIPNFISKKITNQIHFNFNDTQLDLIYRSINLCDLPLDIYGVNPSHNFHFWIAPLNSINKSETELTNEFQIWIEKKFSSVLPNEHVFIFVSERRNGYINNDSFKILSKVKRKTILIHGSPLSKYIVKYSSTIDAFSNFDKIIFESLKLALTKSNLINYFNKNIDFIDSIGHSNIQRILGVSDIIENNPISIGRQKYITDLLGCSKKIYAPHSPEDSYLIDFYIQWGAEPNEAKQRIEPFQTLLGQRKIYVEDGFIRSLGLWTNELEPTCSVVIDTDTVYYDTNNSSLLEKFLNSNWKILNEELSEVNELIESIVNKKISKYNYSPISNLNISNINKKNILILDQKVNDMSIKYGGANSKTFETMLRTALESDAEKIFIKQHPCAITNGQEHSHYSDNKVKKISTDNRIEIISFDINPYSLFNSVSDIYTATSGMGFEALMAKKLVYCFGRPFYSGWGQTNDMLHPLKTKVTRTVEEIFYAFYLKFSRYVNPVTGEKCTLKELIELMDKLRLDNKIK